MSSPPVFNFYDRVRQKFFESSNDRDHLLIPSNSYMPSVGSLECPVASVMRSLPSFTGLVWVCYSCWGWCSVGLGAGDVAVDISYMTFMMRVQYKGYLVLYKSHITTTQSITELTCT